MKGEKERLVDSCTGKVCAVLLAVIWFLSLLSNGQVAYSVFLPTAGLPLIAVLFAAMLLMGYRTVRLNGWAWFSLLGIGGYFLLRAATGYIEYSNYADSSVIMGGMIFYLAGQYCPHSTSQGNTAMRLLAGLLLLQIASMLIMSDDHLPGIFSANSLVRLDGRSVSGCMGLFVYKNFASVFLATGGMGIILHSVLSKRSLFSVRMFLGIGAVVASFFCCSRIAWVLVPFGICFGWGAWLLSFHVQKKRMGWLTVVGTILLFILIGTGAVLALRYGINSFLTVDLNSHARLEINGRALSIPRDFLSSLIGTGARTFSWEVLPYSFISHFPNYAHNEYIQAWVDYGIIGIALIVLTLAGHLMAAGRRIAQAEQPPQFAILSATSLVAICFALHACGEFVWHHPALVFMTAFSLGIMNSPSQKPLKAESRLGKCLLITLSVTIAVTGTYSAVKLAPGWLGQWHYEEAVYQQYSESEKQRVLLSIIQTYPDPDVIGLYARTMAQTKLGEDEIEHITRMLDQAEHSNPHHCINAYTHAAYLDLLHRFEEAEAVLRRMNIPGGTKGGMAYSWHSLYALHLCAWGRTLMEQPEQRAKALSLLEYAYCLLKNRGFESTNRRSDNSALLYFPRDEQKKYLKALENDIALLKWLVKEPDHAWRSPQSGSDRGALFPQDGGKLRRKSK